MNTDKEKHAIEKLIAHYAETLNAAKTDLIPSFYTKDSQFMPDHMKTFSGHDLHDKKNSIFLKKVSFHIDYSINDIVVDGRFAFSQALAKATIIDLATNKQSTKITRDFFVLRKDEVQWKIYRYIFNNVKKNNRIETNKRLK
jgi:ketosteroid isomerase-like protein